MDYKLRVLKEVDGKLYSYPVLATDFTEKLAQVNDMVTFAISECDELFVKSVNVKDLKHLTHLLHVFNEYMVYVYFNEIIIDTRMSAKDYYENAHQMMLYESD